MNQIISLCLSDDATPEDYYDTGIKIWKGIDGLPENRNAALQYILTSAKQEHVPSQIFLGDALLEPSFEPMPPVDPSNHMSNPDITGYSTKNMSNAVAVSWYKRAADNNSPIGMRKLAQCLFKGHGIPQNIPLGIEFSLKASLLGDGESFHILGKYYSGFQETKSLASKFFTKSAATKYPPGMFSAATETNMNPSEAFSLLLESADSNHIRSIYEVGNRYFEGFGVKPNIEQARIWWERGALQGNARCQYQLAKSLEKINPCKSLEFYTHSAHQGLGMACYRLSQIFGSESEPFLSMSNFRQLSMPQSPILTSQDLELFQPDQETSILYLKCAAHLNIQEAQLKLGIHLYNKKSSTNLEYLFLSRKWLLAGLSSESHTESTSSILEKRNNQMMGASPSVTKKSKKISDSGMFPVAKLEEEGRLHRLKYSLKHSINRSEHDILVSQGKKTLLAVEHSLKTTSPIFSSLSQGTMATHDISSVPSSSADESSNISGKLDSMDLDGHSKQNISNLLRLIGYSAQLDTCNAQSIENLLEILKKIQ